ncbi:MAG TPA: RNA methyltransferase [Acidobacteriaceae bacterium]|nr:RNA methyltransferase [Acidobacteriaceae bacterium]
MRARLTVGLVGARNPSNIGAAARAMRDFGFSDLRFVNEYAVPFEAAQLESTRSAVGAAEIMRTARAFGSVSEAIADCTLVVGTTAIGGRQVERQVLALAEAAPLLLEELSSPNARVALLFGSEKTGLTNDQLSHCQVLITIPMFAPAEARHLSMNLGQSVAVCLYELVRGGFENARELPAIGEARVTADTRERLTHLLIEAMDQTGYSRRFPANAREHVVRQLAMHLGKTQDEAATWMGFLRQILRSEKKDAPGI